MKRTRLLLWLGVAGLLAVGVVFAGLYDAPYFTGFDGWPTTLDNWTESGTGTYTTAGNFGYTSPSVRFDNTGDYIISPTIDNGDSVKFWIKGQNTGNSGSFKIYARVGNDSSVIRDCVFDSLGTSGGDIVRNVAKRIAFQLPPAYRGQDDVVYRIVYETKVLGNIAFDDFAVTDYVVSDVTPPSIVSVTVTSLTALDVLFSEPVEQVSAETEANYVVTPGSVNPLLALRDGSNLALVHLTFAATLPTGQDTLTVNGVKDTSANQNQCVDAVGYFSITTAEPGDVVINEIMYDDTASTDIEWAELYNRTASAIDISYWALLDAPAYPPATEGAFYLPAGTIIPAGGYLVVAKEAVPDIDGEVVGIPYYGGGWGLGNSGDNIALYTDTVGGMRIDGWATSNTLLFYPDWTPANSGVSLEKCVEDSPWPDDSTGWHTSTNWFSGASRFRFCTPGAANTPCPDVTAPTINSVVAESPTSILVVFSEPMRKDSAEVASHYSVNFGVGSPTTAALQNPGWNKVRLTFPVAMPANVYTLTVNNVMDLSNNLIAANSQRQFTVGTPEFDIVISEIMPNPAAVADNVGEWFEIYNDGANPVDMAGWTVSDGEGTFTISAGTIGAGGYFVFGCNGNPAVNGGVPVDYVYPYAAGTGLQLANTADDITLRTGGGAVVTTVAYTAAFPWGNGYSMQLKDPNYPLGSDTSWCGAEYVWPGSAGDAGTPGMATICPTPFVPDTVSVCDIRVQTDCGVPVRNHTRVVTYGTFSSLDTCKAIGYLQSQGCAVAVYGGTLFDSMLNVDRYPRTGDSVMIDGYITQFRGLTEIATYASWVPKITLIDSGRTVPVTTVTCTDIGWHADSCRGENFEAQLVQLQNVTFINPSGNFPLADSNFALICGGDTITFRLDSCDVALIGQPIPTGPVNITGVLGQFDSVSCYCQGYQMLAAGGTTITPAVCATPDSLTVIRDGTNDQVILRWRPGVNQTCDCYEIYYTNNASNVFPAGYTYLAHVIGTTTYTDTSALVSPRFYVVTAGGPHCP